MKADRLFVRLAHVTELCSRGFVDFGLFAHNLGSLLTMLDLGIGSTLTIFLF